MKKWIQVIKETYQNLSSKINQNRKAQEANELLNQHIDEDKLRVISTLFPIKTNDAIALMIHRDSKGKISVDRAKEITKLFRK